MVGTEEYFSNLNAWSKFVDEYAVGHGRCASNGTFGRLERVVFNTFVICFDP